MKNELRSYRDKSPVWGQAFTWFKKGRVSGRNLPRNPFRRLIALLTVTKALK